MVHLKRSREEPSLMKKFFNEFKEFITRGNVLDMAIGHLSHIDQYVSIVVQYIYQAECVHFKSSYSVGLLRVVAVIVISEIDVARFIPILREPVSSAVRDLDMHGAVKGIMFPFAIGQLRIYFRFHLANIG